MKPGWTSTSAFIEPGNKVIACLNYEDLNEVVNMGYYNPNSLSKESALLVGIWKPIYRF